MKPRRPAATIVLRSLFVALLVPSCAAASPERDGWEYALSVAAVRLPAVDLDAGGETELTSRHFRAGADRAVHDSTSVGVRFYYDVSDRRFAGPGRFAALEPWEQTSRVGVAGFVRQRAFNGLSLGIRPFVNWSYEAGAFSEDAISYGAAVAVLTGFSRDKRFGAGARIVRDIDGSEKVTPIVIINWQVAEDWTLSNPREANFTAPAGLEIGYRASKQWRFALAGIYATEEFRLDDHGLAPGGTGESSGILTYLRASRHWSWLTLNGYLGAMFNGNLEVNDADGDRLAASHYDTAPFAAVSVEGRF